MTAEEFHKENYEGESFSKLTPTGISDDLEKILAFAKDYHKKEMHRYKNRTELFIGKVADELGFEKTLKMLEESHKEINRAFSK